MVAMLSPRRWSFAQRRPKLGNHGVQTMAIPTYDVLMLPVLRLAARTDSFAYSDAIAELSTELGLSQADLEERLPSGISTRFYGRLGWACTYLRKAGLLRRLRRGVNQITPEGRALLARNPSRITVDLLAELSPEFRVFRASKHDVSEIDDDGGEASQSPEEQMESAHLSLREALANDLLEIIAQKTPEFFEKLVVDLLVAMGYGGSLQDAGKAVGRSRDGGVDGIIKEDRLGLDVVYIQAKRWKESVGRPVVQEFAGSLEGHRARKGVFITTSDFTKDAYDYVSRIEKKIVLISGQQLAEYLIDYGIGVSDVATYKVKRINEDYFEG